MINRGKTSRQQLKERCATLKRYMFYPEGTRRAGHADADEPVGGPGRRSGAAATAGQPAYRARRRAYRIRSASKWTPPRYKTPTTLPRPPLSKRAIRL